MCPAAAARHHVLPLYNDDAGTRRTVATCTRSDSRAPSQDAAREPSRRNHGRKKIGYCLEEASSVRPPRHVCGSPTPSVGRRVLARRCQLKSRPRHRSRRHSRHPCLQVHEEPCSLVPTRTCQTYCVGPHLDGTCKQGGMQNSSFGPSCGTLGHHLIVI